MAGERQIEQVDAELRRVAEAADGLVRAAQELRGTLDVLSESVRAAVREAAREQSVPVPVEPTPVSSPAVESPQAASASVAKAAGADARVGTDASEPEGARIVALNMVLDGKSREEVAAHLRDDLGFADSDALLDDVYSRVG